MASRLTGLLFVLAAGASPGLAFAQSPDLKQQYDAAFNRLFQNSSDLDAIFAFARIAVQTGNIEGAIGAYERMLIYNKNLPTIRYELGRLYFLLGSYDVARTYLLQARDSDAPPEIQADISRLLTQVERKTARNVFSGQVSTGLRYQSNANAAASNGLIRVLGIDALLDQSSRKRPDQDLFVGGALSDIFDFEDQNGDTLEATLSYYANQQFRVHRLTFAIAEMTVGPRIPLLRAEDSLFPLSIRPYLIGTGSLLDYDPFFGAYGGGLDFRSAVTPEITAGLTTEVRRRVFRNTLVNPNLTDKSGHLELVRGLVSYTPTPVDNIVLTAQFARDNAHQTYESYAETSLYASYTRLFSAPFGLTRDAWSGTLTAGRVWRPYDGPELIIDPDSTRNDRQWQLSAVLAVPITSDVAVSLQVQQDWIRSSLPNFRFTDTSVLTSVSFSF